MPTLEQQYVDLLSTPVRIDEGSLGLVLLSTGQWLFKDSQLSTGFDLNDLSEVLCIFALMTDPQAAALEENDDDESDGLEEYVEENWDRLLQNLILRMRA